MRVESWKPFESVLLAIPSGKSKQTIPKHLFHSCKREFAFDYMITVLHLVLHDIVGEGTPISPIATHHPFGTIVAFLERARCYEQKRRKFTLRHLLDDLTGKKKGKAVNGLLFYAFTFEMFCSFNVFVCF